MAEKQILSTGDRQIGTTIPNQRDFLCTEIVQMGCSDNKLPGEVYLDELRRTGEKHEGALLKGSVTEMFFEASIYRLVREPSKQKKVW